MWQPSGSFSKPLGDWGLMVVQCMQGYGYQLQFGDECAQKNACEMGDTSADLHVVEAEGWDLSYK